MACFCGVLFYVKEDTTGGVWTPLKGVVDSALAGGCKPDSTLAKRGIVDSALGAGGYAGRKASPSGLRFRGGRICRTEGQSERTPL